MPVVVAGADLAKLAAVSIPSHSHPPQRRESGRTDGSSDRLVVAVVGATASGKSDLALEIAESLGGEIVNTDSMQLYRGMDVGTAKLAKSGRRGVVHHLLDVLEVTQTATVAQFQVWARAVIADCHGRGVTPVLVGGSALYTRATLDEFEFPGTDPDVRARLEAELAVLGAEALHSRLVRLDPAAGARVQPSNGRRVVRALEVIEITGNPFTAELPEHRYHYRAAVQIGVDIDRVLLERRIADRVEDMWAGGFVEEVRRLLGHGLREGRTANRALGYQQILRVLDGELSEPEAREQTVTRTRRFARRQDSWFHKDQRISWVPHDDPARLERALAAIGRASR